MRIIGGSAKRRILKSVSGLETRPVTDQIKESIFNILQFEITNTRVLDLFAGVGNFGLEALSRGAKSAIFVDLRKECIEALHENISMLKFGNQSEIIQGDVINSIHRLGKESREFDLIFVDPPYSKNFEIPVLQTLSQNKLLTTQGILVMRYHKKTSLDEKEISFTCIRKERYGDTMVAFFKTTF